MPQCLVKLAVIVVAAVSASAAIAATHTIENRTMSVNYDDVAGTFSVVEKPSGNVFLKDGKLAGTAAKTVIAATTDATLGSGKRIVVTRTDGGITLLELYENTRFVLIGGELHNGGRETANLPKMVLATFTLDLGKPTSELRTMGTAGLTQPDKNPGSYLFLTLADPATRRGVVAGWLTDDCGSGVLFSGVKKGQVEFRAQIDYGHLRLRSGQRAKLETLAIGIFDDARIGQEEYAGTIAKHYKIKLHPQIGGYCTWYSERGGCSDSNAKRGAGALNQMDIVTLAEYAAKELKPFGFSFIQIDDQWQDGGKYNGPRRGFDRVRPDGPVPARHQARSPTSSSSLA